MKYFLITLFSVILGDLYTKNIALKYLEKKINILGDFLFLKYTENTGIAFGIALEGIALKILTIILIIILFFYFFKYEYNKKNNLLNISFGLILGGAIGNGVERIFNSKVIDFVGVKYFSVFNLADAAITIGAIIYLFILYKEAKNKKIK